ncbi:MAG: HDIG domain-containing protein, partial [Asgard group archaeon]|nr:HDIG domain-containing protein [Asgard group archaeon]
MNRDEAIKLIKANVENTKLVNHMITVGAIMKGLASKLGEDPILWETVGILHDIDYESTKENFAEHGLKSAEMVKDILKPEGIHAIRAHNWENTGINPETVLDKAL